MTLLRNLLVLSAFAMFSALASAQGISLPEGTTTNTVNPSSDNIFRLPVLSGAFPSFFFHVARTQTPIDQEVTFRVDTVGPSLYSPVEFTLEAGKTAAVFQAHECENGDLIQLLIGADDVKISVALNASETFDFTWHFLPARTVVDTGRETYTVTLYDCVFSQVATYLADPSGRIERMKLILGEDKGFDFFDLIDVNRVTLNSDNACQFILDTVWEGEDFNHRWHVLRTGLGLLWSQDFMSEGEDDWEVPDRCGSKEITLEISAAGNATTPLGIAVGVVVLLSCAGLMYGQYAYGVIDRCCLSSRGLPGAGDVPVKTPEGYVLMDDEGNAKPRIEPIPYTVPYDARSETI